MYIPSLAFISYRTSVVIWVQALSHRRTRATKISDIRHCSPTVAGNTSLLLERHRYVRNPSSTILRSSILPFTRIRHPYYSTDPISCSLPSSLQRPVIGPALSDCLQLEPYPHPLHLRGVPQLSLLPSSLQLL